MCPTPTLIIKSPTVKSTAQCVNYFALVTIIFIATKLEKFVYIKIFWCNLQVVAAHAQIKSVSVFAMVSGKVQ